MSLLQDCQASDGRAHGSTAGVVRENGVAAQRARAFQDGDRVIARPSFLAQGEKRKSLSAPGRLDTISSSTMPGSQRLARAGIAVVAGSRGKSSGTECFVVYDECATFDSHEKIWTACDATSTCPG